MFIGSRYAMLTMKTTISNIIRAYQLETNFKLEDIRIKIDMLTRSVDGYPIRIVKRLINV
jgi:cytochrome P450 family 4